jgi:Pyruvate/2-oxoacid:ferredoxin oxidoreductase gamma subunit
MLGFFTGITGIVSLDAMKKSLLDSVPKGTEQLNMSALLKGYNYGKELIGDKKTKDKTKSKSKSKSKSKTRTKK